MNWYNQIKKFSAYSNYPIAKQLKIFPLKDGKKVNIEFIMQRGNASFSLITRYPVEISSFNRNDVVGTFRQQQQSGNLTTPKAESERKALQDSKPAVNTNISEIKQEQPIAKNVQKQPVQQEWKSQILGYASKRSILLHKQSRVNKMKGGRGDKLDVKDVNKEELIRGIEIELEHVGKGLDISKDSIRKFVEDQLDGNKTRIEHQDILETSQDIAVDHLAEIADYYTRLDKMEQEAEG